MLNKFTFPKNDMLMHNIRRTNDYEPAIATECNLLVNHTKCVISVTTKDTKVFLRSDRQTEIRLTKAETNYLTEIILDKAGVPSREALQDLMEAEHDYSNLTDAVRTAEYTLQNIHLSAYLGHNIKCGHMDYSSELPEPVKITGVFSGSYDKKQGVFVLEYKRADYGTTNDDWNTFFASATFFADENTAQPNTYNRIDRMSETETLEIERQAAVLLDIGFDDYATIENTLCSKPDKNIPLPELDKNALPF